MVGILVGGCWYAKSWCDIGLTFDHSSARMLSTATFETNHYFSNHKSIWIVATDYYI